MQNLVAFPMSLQVFVSEWLFYKFSLFSVVAHLIAHSLTVSSIEVIGLS